MKKNKRLVTYLILFLLVQANVAPLALAQRRNAPAPVESPAQETVRGTRQLISAGATVNFAEMSRQEALDPVWSNISPRSIRSPKRSPLETLDSQANPAGDTTQGTRQGASAEDTPGRPLVPSPAPASSFLATLDQPNDGFSNIPPDTHGAVGPNHLVVAVNGRVRIQDRAGNVISTVGQHTFWARLFPGRPAGPGADRMDVFDPRVHYDQMANRFMMCAVADSNEPRSSLVIGVSQTGDPTGNWNLYLIDSDSTDARWADFPIMGFNKNWIAVHANMFTLNSSGSNTGKIFVFRKSDLYAGVASPSLSTFDQPGNGFTMAPATTFDASLEALYLVQSPFTSGLRVSRLIPDGAGSPVLEFGVATPNAPFTWRGFGTGSAAEGFAPQKDSPKLIETGDTRVQSVVVRNGSIWVAHTIFLPGTSAATRSSVQWWQIDIGSLATVQRGLVDDANSADGTNFYAYPSLAVNAQNDVLIGYSRFSAGQYASANYSFRAGTDAANTLREDVVLKAGEGPYFKTFGASSNRWGDYSATVVDPANDLDMWTIQEYAATPTGAAEDPGRWGTWWGRVGLSAAPGPAPTPLAAPPNDHFAAAKPIRGASGTETVNTGLATKEAGEPSHHSDGIGGKSVWYRWTASASGTATLDTTGSNFDTLLAVYTGTNVGALTQIISNDDQSTGVITASRVQFNAVAGTTYRIVVDGFNDSANGDPASADAGPAVLNWNLPVGAANLIDNSQFFVTQQYRDFLNREPDAAGLAFWTNQIEECGASTVCREIRRINASAAFFLSIEFQETGYLVYKTYKASFGDIPGTPVPLTLGEFLPDTQTVSNGVIIGQAGAEARLEQNKAAFFNAFVQRARFTSVYGSLSPALFVDTLNTNTGGSLSLPERNALVNELTANNNVAGRASVLRKVAENAEFTRREKNRAFVLMQYFGYLRRNPPDAPEASRDYAGYQFWLGKLDAAGGNFVNSDMVQSFIISTEYRQMFGP